MRKVCLLALFAAAVVTPSLRATSITYTTIPNDTTANLPISAAATFNLGMNTLTLTLSNLVVDQTSVGQNLSDIFFSLNGLTIGSVTGMQSGLIYMDNYKQTVIDPPATNTSLPAADFWGLAGGNFTVLGSPITGFHLDALANGNDYTLLGSPNASSVYSNANSSLTNGHGDPFLYSKVTFTFDIPGLTADTKVSNVVFSFGTGTGDNHASVCTEGCGNVTITDTPEPASMGMLGIGLVAISFVSRKFVTRTSAQKQ